LSFREDRTVLIPTARNREGTGLQDRLSFRENRTVLIPTAHDREGTGLQDRLSFREDRTSDTRTRYPHCMCYENKIKWYRIATGHYILLVCINTRPMNRMEGVEKKLHAFLSSVLDRDKQST
jgi:hypothetical protein